MKIAAVRFLLLLTPLILPAQESRVAFSDEGRPRFVKAELLNGSITVRGYAGKEAIMTTDAAGSRGISLTEQNNVITISGGPRHNGSIDIQVPYETSLQLRCTNCREMRVENIKGDIDVHAVNGIIRLQNVSGSVLAHSLNQGIIAVIDHVDPSKPSSFSSMNGTLDCTFPADLKANVKMRTENGKIHTDFDIRIGGGVIMRTDRGISGSIGGGGPDIQFKAFNGSIFIRKKS